MDTNKEIASELVAKFCDISGSMSMDGSYPKVLVNMIENSLSSNNFAELDSHKLVSDFCKNTGAFNLNYRYANFLIKLINGCFIQKMIEHFKPTFIELMSSMDINTSECRIPFTYHHDNLRSENKNLDSRADAAQALSSHFKDKHGCLGMEYIKEAFRGSIRYHAKNNDDSNLVLNKAEQTFDFFKREQTSPIIS
jgi:hypothetical protein